MLCCLRMYLYDNSFVLVILVVLIYPSFSKLILKPKIIKTSAAVVIVVGVNELQWWTFLKLENIESIYFDLNGGNK